MALAASLRSIGDLAGWDRVDSLAERVADALRGVEGLSRADARAVARISAAWCALPERERGFLASRLRDESVVGAAARVTVSHLVDGSPERVDGWVRGVLGRAWLDEFGLTALDSGANLWRK